MIATASSKCADLLDLAPPTAGELPAWFASLTDAQLQSVFVAELVDRFLAEELSASVLSECLGVVRSRWRSEQPVLHPKPQATDSAGVTRRRGRAASPELVAFLAERRDELIRAHDFPPQCLQRARGTTTERVIAARRFLTATLRRAEGGPSLPPHQWAIVAHVMGYGCDISAMTAAYEFNRRESQILSLLNIAPQAPSTAPGAAA